MNKKFSTLMAGLVLATGMVSADTYISPNPFTQGGFPYRTMDTEVTAAFSSPLTANQISKIESENKWYQLTDGTGNVLIQVRETTTGDVTLKMVPAFTTGSPSTGAPLNYSLWKIKVTEHPVTAAKVYTYINKETNLELVLDDTRALDIKDPVTPIANINTEDATILTGCTNQWSWYTTDELVAPSKFAAEPIYSYFHNSDSVMVMQKKTNGEVVASKYDKRFAGNNLAGLTGSDIPLKLMPVIAQGVALTAADLNAMIDAQEINTLNPADSAKFKFSEPTGKLNAALQSITNNVLGSEKGFKAYDQYLYREFGKAGLTDIASELTAGKALLAAVSAKFTAVNTDAAVTAAANTAATAATTAATAAGAAATNATTKATALYTKALNPPTVTASTITTEFTTEFTTGRDALGQPATANSIAKALTEAKTAAANIKGTAGATQATKDAMDALTDLIDADLALIANAYTKANKGVTDMPKTLTFTSGTEDVNAFGIRLVDENGKYFMVDTLRYEEAQAPSVSPAYQLVTKTFDIKANAAFVAARYFFRVTYYPSNDSLAIEPLNAASKTNAEATAKTDWVATDAGMDWVKVANITGAKIGLTASNTETNTVAVSPIAITTSELANGDLVATAGPKDPNGSFRTRISFVHVYPYLVRSTVESGLYNISLVTNDKNSNATTLSRVNGSHIVANMAGEFVYAKKDKSQDYTHMPATQWVVEQLGCLKPNSTVARVRVVNREYKDVAFEGQLYVDAAGNQYMINRTPSLTIGNNKFNYRDTLKFDPIADTKKGYLNLKEDTLRENTYTFNQFFNYGEDPYFLNVKDNKADTLVRAQKEATQFELFIVGTDSVKYGYKSDQAGVDQLWRTAYKLKVKDANKVDNDRKFVAVDQNNKYVVALEKDIDAGLNGLRYAQFYFKENNHWVEGETGKEYYALVDVINNTNGNWKLSIEQGQMDTKPEALGESRTEAFYIGKDNRPLYRSLGKNNSVVKIYTERGTAKEYLYEDGSNKINYPSAIKDFNYLGITSAGITPDGEGTTVALYADYVQKSNDRMPQYLFAVDIDSVKAYTWCKDHGLNPGCSHADPYAGYIAGRFLVNLNDSIDNSINKLQDAAKFKYDNYTRLAFVDAVHRGDSLYVLKDGIKLASIMAKDPSGKSYILPANLDKANEGKVYDIVVLNGKHNNAAFSLRLVDDAEAQDFYLESNGNGNDSGIGSFKGAWVKLQNYVPVLAQTTEDNGNHDGSTGGILETINQAQKFNIAENVDEIPTDSQTPEVSTISVNADYGKVIIKGAAGKTVTVTNVLGQTIANTVISSNEATISASAGLVVVSVEGEEAVKAIVK